MAHEPRHLVTTNVLACSHHRLPHLARNVGSEVGGAQGREDHQKGDFAHDPGRGFTGLCGLVNAWNEVPGGNNATFSYTGPRVFLTFPEWSCSRLSVTSVRYALQRWQNVPCWEVRQCHGGIRDEVSLPPRSS